MFDSIAHHLSPDLFFVALAGHLVLESSAKVALHGVRHLVYLAAVVMLPILMQVVMHHERANAEHGVPRKQCQRRRNPKRE